MVSTLRRPFLRGRLGASKAAVLGRMHLSWDNVVGLSAVKLALNPRVGVRQDGAAQFTAANSEYLQIVHASQSGLDLGTTDFSMTAWVYRDATGATHVIFSKSQDANTRWLLFVSNADDLLYLQVRKSGIDIEVKSTSTLSASTWYHVAVVVDRDSAADTKLYLNGVDDTSGTPTVDTQNHDNTGDFELGRYSVSPAGNYMDGRLDSAAIWTGGRLLTAAEVTWLYNSGKGRIWNDIEAGTGDGANLNDANLKAWYDLGEDDGEVRFDSKGSNNLTDNATVTRVQGIQGGDATDYNLAGSYDGVNQNLSHAQDNNFEIEAGDWTLEVWIRPNDATPDALEYVVGPRTDSSNFWYLGLQTGGTLEFLTKETTDKDKVNSASALSSQTWHHIVVTLDRGVASKLYLDNVDDSTGASTTTADLNSGGTFSIGAVGGGLNHFTGLIDVVRIWKGTALSAANVTTLFNNGYGLKYADLPSGFTAPTFASDGEDLEDKTGTVTDLTNNNSVTFTSEGVGYSAGVVGTWEDQSGNSNDLSQATISKRPGYVSKPLDSSEVAVFGGNPAIKFDGSDDILTRASAFLSGNVGGVFLLFHPVDVTGNQSLFAVSQTGVSTDVVNLRMKTDGINIQHLVASQEDQVDGAIVLAGGNNYILSYLSNGSEYTLRVNRVIDSKTASPGTDSGDWMDDPTGLDTVAIGATSVATETAHSEGFLGPVIAIDGEYPSSSLINDVERLLDRYASGVAIG